MLRIEGLVGHAADDRLRQAVANADVALLLGDGLIRRLPQQLASGVNSAVCDFLNIAWRKRRPLWRGLCEDGNEWKLKP